MLIKNLRLHCTFSNKIFTLKSLMLSKKFKRGVFLLSKIRIKNSAGVDTHIGKLLIYFGDSIEDIGTTIPERKSG